MSGNTELTYWMNNKDWYKINRELDCFELTEKAPESARISFEKWKTLQDTR